MSRAESKYRPQVEQVESRQLLSGFPAGDMAPSRKGHIASIGEGFVGYSDKSATALYLSSLVNNTGELLKIDLVVTTGFRAQSNFVEPTSPMEHGGQILMWTQVPTATFRLKFSLPKDPTISATKTFTKGATTTPAKFITPGTDPGQVGWADADFPLAKPFEVVTVTNIQGVIKGIKVEPVPTT